MHTHTHTHIIMNNITYTQHKTHTKHTQRATAMHE